MLFFFRPRLVRRRARLLRLYRRPLLYLLTALLLLDVWCILLGRGSTVRVVPQAAVEPEAAVAAADSDAAERGSAPTADPPTAADSSNSAGASATTNTSVFIVSVHRNTEVVLRAAWLRAVVALAEHLGPDNVFVSAVESGSQDYTKEALMHLHADLDARGIGHAISLGPDVWGQLDELYAWPDPESPPSERPGWIWDPDEGHFALRRIPYLARVRNQAMEPLQQLAATEGRRFDRVLWINDVVFDTSDALTLLATHDSSYAAACAVDFMVYPQYYDTFALRDAYGAKAVSAYWPWLRGTAAQADVRAGRPVRVQSCWNGMIAFDARPFYADNENGPDARPPLTFRGVPDSLAEFHLEGSECCLIHADNPLSGRLGVWLNPNVRVAYSVPVYAQVRRDVFPGAGAAVLGAWANRWDRVLGLWRDVLEAQTLVRRLRQWRAATPAGEPARTEEGGVCLINEMQIMWQNGWKHL